MTFKSVLTICTSEAQAREMVPAAEALAQSQAGHLETLCIGVEFIQAAYYDSTASAIAVQASLGHAQEEAHGIKAAAEALLRTSPVAYALDALVCRPEEAQRIADLHARFSDILVADLPYGAGKSHTDAALIETVLFDARLPVLLLPAGIKAPAAPRRVVLAWDESIEALTAARKALPLLRQADQVRVVIIDPPQHGPDRSDPGGRLCQMLARHGISCEIDILSKTLPRVSDVLKRHARDMDADLIVMGAYGHSRFREAVLGGTTRNMLEGAELPVFLAH